MFEYWNCSYQLQPFTAVETVFQPNMVATHGISACGRKEQGNSKFKIIPICSMILRPLLTPQWDHVWQTSRNTSSLSHKSMFMLGAEHLFWISSSHRYFQWCSSNSHWHVKVAHFCCGRMKGEAVIQQCSKMNSKKASFIKFGRVQPISGSNSLTWWMICMTKNKDELKQLHTWSMRDALFFPIAEMQWKS